MQIGVIGAGGVGGYYGGILADNGHQVRLLARGAHLEAIRSRGLEIRTPERTLAVPVAASDHPSALRGSEFVILAVKSYSLEELAPALRDVAEHGATVVSLLNGIGIGERLISYGVPPESILEGLTFVSAAKISPGVIQRHSPFQRVVVGEADGSVSARAEAFAGALRDAGVDALASRHIELELWQKFIFIASLGAACGLARSTVGAVREARLGWRLIERAVGEVAGVARAAGVPLPEDDEQRTLGAIRNLAPHLKPSLLLDVEQGGRTELDVLCGAVSERGARLGVDTPVHDTATAALGAYLAAAD